jgi:hypothetical protein
MKKFGILTLFCLIYAASFAQRFGVDVGYGYTIDNFKLDPNEVGAAYISDVHLKQKLFPNASLRTFLKIYGKSCLYLGADLASYMFTYFREFPKNPYFNYKRLLLVSDVHIPLMYRLEIAKWEHKHPLAIYGGIFARFPVWAKTKITWEHMTSGDMGNTEVFIKEKKQAYTNFVLGLHQSLLCRDWLHSYIDFQVKYMPGDFYTIDIPVGMMYAPTRIQNRYTYTFTLGFSFLKPDKEKSSDANPARLQD